MALRPTNSSYLSNNSSNSVAPPNNKSSSLAVQFQTWSREKDAFRQAAETSNRERQRVEQQLHDVRALQTATHQEIHATSTSLGRVHREREMLLKERARLQHVLAQERVALEQCALENEQVVQAERMQKKDFSQIMKEMNGELGDLLMKQEDFRLQNMISVDTLPLLTQHYAHQTGVTPDSGTSKDDGGNKTAAELDQASLLLMEKTDMYRSSNQEYQTLHATLEEFRARALKLALSKDGSSTQCLTMANLEQLETNWTENRMVDDDNDEGEAAGRAPTTSGAGGAVLMDDPVHVQLFYGSGGHGDDSSTGTAATTMTTETMDTVNNATNNDIQHQQRGLMDA